MQKNRFCRLPKPLRLNFGNAGYITDREGRIELIHLAFFKKKIKKLIKKVDLRFEMRKEQVWFFITPNFLIQKKSKNSRMGKGKGLVERKTVRLRKNVPIFEFYGFPFPLLKRMLFKLNKKMNLKLRLINDRVHKTRFWGSRDKYIILYEKYLNS